MFRRRSSSLALCALLRSIAPARSQSSDSDSGACSSVCPPLLVDSSVPVPSLCVGDSVASIRSSKSYDVCDPPSSPKFDFDSRKGPGKVTVVANYFTGCEAGRRESGVFAHVAQRVHDANPDVSFVVSLKGGGSCKTWADIFQGDASAYGDGDVPTTMPLTISDDNYDLRDYFFTSPFPHPSYVVLDSNLTVRNKFVGPCCGYVSFFACTADVAIGLDRMLTDAIEEVLDGYGSPAVTTTTTAVPATWTPSTTTTSSPPPEGCETGPFGDWSPCSTTCGPGVKFRWRTVRDDRGEGTDGDAIDRNPCPSPVETSPCVGPEGPTCSPLCVPEFGRDAEREIVVVASGFDDPRDVAFHPTPGLHLGSHSEGRTFRPDRGEEEAWVVNGFNHTVSIVASLGDPEYQTTLSRTDRGYYHYLINVTALAFNAVNDSDRESSRDGFNYWAVCNDNDNDYLTSKEANYFMGPTLYNSDPSGGNTVNRLGDACRPNEPCFFLHADMLHESPSCVGIAHDPERNTAYGNVYWAFDSKGDLRGNGHLVRFDFQQPHGPGSMDHSVAAVRRYPEAKLRRGPKGAHAGMVVHPEFREVFVSSPGDGKVYAIGADTGSYSRTAREEYPIFSNRLPSFEYSVYECVERRTFADGLSTPTGLALSADGERLFVAEREGKISCFEARSGAFLASVETGYASLGGIAVSPVTNAVHFVDADSNVLGAVKPSSGCDGGAPSPPSRLSSEFVSFLEDARSTLDGIGGEGYFSLHRDYQCRANAVIPNGTLFEQVHVGSGYASNDTNVQSTAGMDANAALLADRTDCDPTSDLNFDALLLGGYYCHACLPRNRGASCDPGGSCANVQWRGFTCDNEFFASIVDGSVVLSDAHGDPLDATSPLLARGVTYRFAASGGDDVPIALFADASLTVPASIPGNPTASARNGPLIVPVTADSPRRLYLSTTPGVPALALEVSDDGAAVARAADGPADPSSDGASPRREAGRNVRLAFGIGLASLARFLL